MCGISGIINFTNKEVNKVDLKRINNALIHRGPDAEGYWYNNDKTVGFGHRRLSILDLSKNANLPMCYNNRYWITYNGEIYNFIELKQELEQKGYVFKTDTDTEVLLAAYNQWGESMQNKLNGMWAFAIYDTHNQSIFLSRDRYGIKPLYYYHTKEQFIFASEVQAIHKYLGNNHKLNSKVMNNIAIGMFDSFGINETYVDNVYALPSGNSIYIKNGNVEKKTWYSLVVKYHKADPKKLQKLIVNACNIRLRSDVTVGTCLSGGVDSGSISSII
jgi:asparagine synthase (glutamine-hydrolysing)